MSENTSDKVKSSLLKLADSHGRLISTALLTELFDNFTEAVMVTDADRRIIYINHATESLFDYSKKDLYGQKTKILYATESEFIKQGEKRFNQQSKISVDEFKIVYQRADGGKFTGLTTGAVMRSEDQTVVGYFGVIRPARTAEESLNTLQKLHAVMADVSLNHTQQIEALLTIGLNHFSLEIAIQSHIQGEDYLVEHCVDLNEELTADTRFKLPGTYCVHTVNADNPVGFHYAGKSSIQNHPCYLDFKLESYIGARISLNGELYGTLNFSGQQPSEPFTKDDYILVELMADMIANLIYKDQHGRKLWEMATRDALTGLHNRRSALERLNQHIDLANRSGLPFTVVIIDIDHFKSINDQWGHSAGDAVLIEFADIVSQIGRRVDFCARIGGEEFILVLPNTKAQDGVVIAEDLRKQLAATPIKLTNGEVISITVSAGVACLHKNEDLESVLSRADKAMYDAKKSGRDQVCVSAST